MTSPTDQGSAYPQPGLSPFEAIIDGLDACIFTGDSLESEDNRRLLHEHCKRWLRALVPSPNARALARVIEAWEKLDEDDYSLQAIKDWLNGPMKAAIDHARLTLRGPQ